MAAGRFPPFLTGLPQPLCGRRPCVAALVIWATGERKISSLCLKRRESQQGTQAAGKEQLETRARQSEKAPVESKAASSADAFHLERAMVMKYYSPVKGK